MSNTTSITHNNKKIRAALIDLSGTLHVGDTPIDGAVQAMERLKEADIPTLFLTNTTKVSSQTLHQQLQDMGFTSISPQNIMTSTLACRTFLQQHDLRPYCLLESLEDFQGHVPLEPPHDSVVVGLAPSKFDYNHFNQAFSILQNTCNMTHALIAIHRGMYYRDSNQQLSLGPGGFVTCLEDASNKRAVVIGKPNPEFYQAALQQLHMSDYFSENVCMVGDDVSSDICGAHEAGVGTTILVQTGKYQAGDEHKAPTESIVVPSIVQAVDYILLQH